MIKSEPREKLPLDARLLCDTIIEINICRRNVALYPKGHRVVDESLIRAFDFLGKLFEIRTEITLKVAKETLIIDDYYLDKKNFVYREFAQCLSGKNIMYVTFRKGLTLQELYRFQQCICVDTKNSPPEEVQKLFRERAGEGIDVGFVKYEAFSFAPGKREDEGSDEHLWERYVYGLMEGNETSEEQSKVIQRIPPEALAQLINGSALDAAAGEASYERVVVNYLKMSSDRIFSTSDLKKLLAFINQLRPDLKRQFLTASFKRFPGEPETAEQVLRGLGVEEVMGLLNTINDQKITIPESVKNMLEKLAGLSPETGAPCVYGEGCSADDILLPQETVQMLSEDNYRAFVSTAYDSEIKTILECDASQLKQAGADGYAEELGGEAIERCFNETILDMVSSDAASLLTEKDCRFYEDLLKDQIGYFTGLGWYAKVCDIVSALNVHLTDNRWPSLTLYIASPDYMMLLVDSFRVMGRQRRSEAMQLCSLYGERIIPLLMDVLLHEESMPVRKFFLDLIIHLGDKAVPEAIQHLRDSRWFVKRNMLCILSECRNREALSYVRPYCYHSHPKISFQAIKCLLNCDDAQGYEALRHYLDSKNKELVRRAIVIAGAYKVRDAVPQLIALLEKSGGNSDDIDNKILAIKALRQIDDPRALDAFRRVLSSRSIFFKRPAEQLKKEVSAALKAHG